MSKREARKWFAAAGILAVAVVPVLLPSSRGGARACAHARTTRSPDETGAKLLRDRARRLVERGEVGEAIDLATLAAQLAPDDPDSWRLLSAVHSAAGHRQQTISSCR